MSVEPGQIYWSLIEPFWLPLNEAWDKGPDGFLARFHEVPAKVGHLYAAHWCQSEVNNGGLWQFFFNTTGLLAPEAAEGFRAIELPDMSAILTEAMAYFGVRYPRERSIRLIELPEWNRSNRREWDPFVALDERFYAALRTEDDCWNRWEHAADRYASLA